MTEKVRSFEALLTSIMGKLLLLQEELTENDIVTDTPEQSSTDEVFQVSEPVAPKSLNVLFQYNIPTASVDDSILSDDPLLADKAAANREQKRKLIADDQVNIDRTFQRLKAQQVGCTHCAFIIDHMTQKYEVCNCHTRIIYMYH